HTSFRWDWARGSSSGRAGFIWSGNLIYNPQYQGSCGSTSLKHMPKKREQEAMGMSKEPWGTSAMRSSSLCCTPPLPPALLSLLPLPPLLPSSMLLTARLPLCLCCPGGCAWRLDQCALPEAAPAIFVPGGAVAQTRLAGEGIPAEPGMAPPTTEKMPYSWISWRDFLN
ncbi:mCG116457, partial [Mus musculus]